MCLYAIAHPWRSEDNSHECVLTFHQVGAFIKLRLSGLAESVFPHWARSRATGGYL